jgi:hypothetical protein
MGGWQRVLFDQFSVKLRVLRPGIGTLWCQLNKVAIFVLFTRMPDILGYLQIDRPDPSSIIDGEAVGSLGGR